MIKAVDLRKGRIVTYENKAYVVHDATHVAKGNKRSYMQAKLKDLVGATMLEVRFNVDDRLETPFVEEKEYEYLYQDGTAYVLMDPTTYDQINVNASLVGEAAKFLKPNEKVSCQILDGQMIAMELPHVVELEITDTPPAIKGATATNQTKDATLETGARIKVPPFIAPGDRVRVDTRSGEYVERAK